MEREALRQKAVQLRKEGKTYAEIRKITGAFNLPKSTLSYWCGGVPLSKELKEKIDLLQVENAKRGRAKAVIVNREKRIAYLGSIEKRIAHLTEHLSDVNTKKLLLAMLYLGEGAKWKSHRSLQLGNANPEVIKLYLNLLESCYGVDRGKLTAMIFHRADQDLTKLIEFWSNTSGIPTKNFYRNKPDSRTIGKPTIANYYGVCAIFGPNTDIQLELEAIAKMLFNVLN